MNNAKVKCYRCGCTSGVFYREEDKFICKPCWRIRAAEQGEDGDYEEEREYEE